MLSICCLGAVSMLFRCLNDIVCTGQTGKKRDEWRLIVQLRNLRQCRRMLKSAEEVPKSAEVDQMTKQEEVLYKYILEKGSITTADVCQLFDVKERRARDILSNMCKKNFLRKQGATSSTKYVLNKC